MTLTDFLAFVQTRKALSTPEIHRFMDEMSDEARRITFELNAAYHTPDEVRAMLSRLFGRPVDPTLRVFPPFYTDFGKNISIGKNVFINACCHFQDHGGVTIGDGCQIGHAVVFATLNHGLAPADRANTYPAPITLGAQRMGRLQRHHPARRQHRRQRHCGRRRRRHQGRGPRDHSRRSTRTLHQGHRLTPSCHFPQ